MNGDSSIEASQNSNCKFGRDCRNLKKGNCFLAHPTNSNFNAEKQFREHFARPCKYGTECVHLKKGECNFFHPNNLNENQPGQKHQTKISTTGVDKEMTQNLNVLESKELTQKSIPDFTKELNNVELERLDIFGLNSISKIIAKARRCSQQEKTLFLYELSLINTLYGKEILGILRTEALGSKNTKNVSIAIEIIDIFLEFYISSLQINQRAYSKLSAKTVCDFIKTFADHMLKNKYDIPIGESEIKDSKTLKGFELRVKNLGDLYNALVAKNEAKRVKNTIILTQNKETDGEEKNDPADNLPPPNNFRTIDLFYNYEKMQEEEPFLRKIRKKGPYESETQYLDIHFRLLIEDFYSSVKNGVQIHRQNLATNQKRIKTEGLFVFKGRMEGFLPTHQAICLKLKIPIAKKQRVGAKRFIFGSMILISLNDFNDFLICIVRDKNEKGLKPNKDKYGKIKNMKDQQEKFLEILVEVKSNGGISYSLVNQYSDRELMIAETSTYFESYYHCLKNLQSIENLPFANLIVFSRKSENITPEYLCLPRVDQNRITYEIKPEVLLEITKHVKLSNFDESQKDAVVQAFRRQLCIVQGPPGTGKTYISIIIVRILLKLKAIIGGPIFIICYTNHALDQFLEHLIPYTDKIIRLGGRCKNPNLERFTLNYQKKNKMIKSSKEAGYYIFLRRKKEEIFQTMSEIFNFSQKLMFLCDEVFLEDGEHELFEEVVENYKKEFELYLKKISSNQKNFKEFVQKRLKPLSNFGQAILYWLSMLDFNVIYSDFLDWIHKLKIQQEKKKNSPQEKQDSDDEFLEMAEKALLLENNHLVENENNHTNYFKEGNSIEDFLESSPLIISDQNYANNYDMIFFEREYFQKSWKETEQIFQDCLKILNGEEKTIRKKHIEIEKRWAVSNYFIERKRIHAKSQMESLILEINQLREKAEEAETFALSKILKESDIIGVTTTGASKQIHLLRKIPSQITIVEEAAEVLESHIITSLTSNLKHLILVGDHKQLRPKVNNMDIGSNYNLEISLFERLVHNEYVKSEILVQRRMRPEISEIIRLFYPNLKDDQSVLNRQNIRGMSSNVLFFTHEWNEEKTELGKESKSNIKEANFVIKFTELLIKNGYKQEEIIILSLYAGQLLYIKTKLSKIDFLRNIRVCTVDDFQGEEGKIILLSLVRSNEQNRIGFLKFDNRINVAFSRARDGLYVFGNAKCVRNYYQKNSTKEPDLLLYKIVNHCNEKDILKDHIKLICQNHKNEVILKDEYDFQKSPEGGCMKLCDLRQNCGHQCQLFCHYFEISYSDTDGHKDKPCMQMCQRNHNCEHGCVKICCDCDPKKFRCVKTVKITNQKCLHTYSVSCCDKDLPESKLCQTKCTLTLRCGHPCYKKCHEYCNEISFEQEDRGFTTSCTHNVDIKLDCGHDSKKPCGQKLESFLKTKICKEVCDKKLECGDSCKGKCNECRKIVNEKVTYYHANCKEKCKKINCCGHECRDFCAGEKGCSPCIDQCYIRCSHSKCPKKCGEVCANCVQKCEYSCFHHKCEKKCYEICERPPCSEPCNKLLECKHQCIGFCGEDCPSICRICHPQNETFEILFGEEDEPLARFTKLDCGHCFVGSSLDRYMNDFLEKQTVIFPTCPKCKRNILFSMRYQRIIKKTVQKINIIKSKILENVEKMFFEIQLFKFDPKVLGILKIYPELQNFESEILKFCQKCSKSGLQINSILRIIEMVNFLCKVLSKFKIPANNNFCQIFLQEICPKILNQHISDENSQILILAIRSFDHYYNFEDLIKKFDDDILGTMKVTHKTVFNKIGQWTRYIENNRGFLNKKDINEIEKFLKLNVNVFESLKMLTIENFQLINKILNLPPGHWNVCPNGHPYVIADCGGANQVSICADCGSAVGGERHTLTNGNRQANLDGSGPSWDPGNLARDMQIAQQMQRNQF